MTLEPDILRSVVAALDTDLNRHAVWHSIPLEDRLWLATELFRNKTPLADLKKALFDRCGEKISAAGLSRYVAKMRAYLKSVTDRKETQERIVGRLMGARALTDEVETLATRTLPGITNSLAGLLGESVLDALGKSKLELDDIAALADPLKAVFDALRVAQGDRNLSLKERQLSQADLRLRESLKEERERALDALAAEIQGNEAARAAFENLQKALAKSDKALS